eukprot:CAMPEP_0171748722 /NCGR_PEP_ID=MMETSP0991-20121206/40295_1 /TAXON_ID=483369 /ORGANISM="non described non described, Strain CCMP2098" /LENGTH=60 /DNA_ID=CAMNT_0012349179 /DNA_START=68 /DNA_END=247 /DNA_ORIENTATION=-
MGEATYTGAKSRGVIRALKAQKAVALLTEGVSSARSLIVKRAPKAQLVGASLMGEASGAR